MVLLNVIEREIRSSDPDEVYVKPPASVEDAALILA